MGRRPWSAASQRSRTEGAAVTSPPSHHRPQAPSSLLPLQLSQHPPAARLFPLATAARPRPPAARPPAAAAAGAVAGGGGAHDELLQYVGPLRPLVVPAHPLLRVVWHRRLCRCPVPARRPLAHLSPVRNKQPGRQASQAGKPGRQASQADRQASRRPPERQRIVYPKLTGSSHTAAHERQAARTVVSRASAADPTSSDGVGIGGLK